MRCDTLPPIVTDTPKVLGHRMVCFLRRARIVGDIALAWVLLQVLFHKLPECVAVGQLRLMVIGWPITRRMMDCGETFAWRRPPVCTL